MVIDAFDHSYKCDSLIKHRKKNIAMLQVLVASGWSQKIANSNGRTNPRIWCITTLVVVKKLGSTCESVGASYYGVVSTLTTVKSRNAHAV